jgi:hypothetical protein
MSANRAGSGTVVAVTSGQRLVIPYTVEPGPPAKIRASFGLAPNNPSDRSYLTIMVTDQYGNAVPDQTVNVKVRGGEVERTEAQTGKTGTVTLEVVWESDLKGEALIACGNVPQVTITRRIIK